MQTVAETKAYANRAEKLLTESERDRVVDMIAFDPLKGDIITGTGGVRKVRFAKDGTGKSGSVRVVYYLYNENNPIYLLALFGKNEKSNLSKAERNALGQFVKELKKEMRGN